MQPEVAIRRAIEALKTMGIITTPEEIAEAEERLWREAFPPSQTNSEEESEK